MPPEPLSLYLHIPFCESKCPYCDFFSVPRRLDDSSVLEDYVRALVREIEARAPEFSEREVLSIYFGGGTPSLLGPLLMERVLSALRRHFHWEAVTEVTLEANPKTVSLETLRAFRSMGFNRISIGVQSLQDRFLKVLGRIHTASEARRTVEEAREAGFENINIDLIFGLPGQTLSDWEEDLEEGLSLGTPHLSAYALTIGKEIQSEDFALFFSFARLHACRVRVEAYEISNFSKIGFESVHNRNYWRYGEYLGFGTSAVSFVKGAPSGPLAFPFAVRRTNVRDLGRYLAGDWEGEAEPIDFPTAMGEFCMLALRTREGIREVAFQKEFGHSFSEVYGRQIARWVERGWLEGFEENQPRRGVEGEAPSGFARGGGDASPYKDGWRLTEDGILFADEVAQSFLP